MSQFVILSGLYSRFTINGELSIYLLTLWSRILLEKLIGSQLVKKYTAFYGTQKFIPAFTSARHLSLF